MAVGLSSTVEELVKEINKKAESDAIPDVSGKANLDGGNTFKGKQTLNSPASDGYSINAAGYIKGSWLQAPATLNKGSGTGKVCVLDNNGWIYYRTPAEIVAEAGGGGATDAVKYTAQTLTASQKTQARSNIGAGTGNGTVTGVKINGLTKGTSGVVDLGYIKVKVNGTTYTADSDGLIDLGTISGGGSASTSQYNDIY